MPDPAMLIEQAVVLDGFGFQRTGVHFFELVLNDEVIARRRVTVYDRPVTLVEREIPQP